MLFRSNIGQSRLKGHINNLRFVVFDKIKNYEFKRFENETLNIRIVNGLLAGIFFLLLSDPMKDYTNLAEEEIEKIVDLQNEHGAIFNDVMLTAAFILALNLANSDPKKS